MKKYIGMAWPSDGLNDSEYWQLIPKNIEACPLELAPTSSTTCTLALGDALAVTLLKKKKIHRK